MDDRPTDGRHPLNYVSVDGAVEPYSACLPAWPTTDRSTTPPSFTDNYSNDNVSNQFII
jgi:hypothetical protein